MGHLHLLTRAVEQRSRAGAIKGTDPRSQAKRDLLNTMAERNELQAEIAQRKAAGHELGSARRRRAEVDRRLVAIRDRLDQLGIAIKHKP